MLSKALLAYPNQIEITKEIVGLWHERLESISFERGLENLNRHIDSSKFFPAIADIIKRDTEHYVDHTQLKLETDNRLRMLKALEAKAPTPEERAAIRKRVVSGELREKYKNDPYLGGW